MIFKIYDRYINNGFFYLLMETESVVVPKKLFGKILEDVELLIDDVELALDEKVRERIQDIESGRVEGKSEEELDAYLKKRGVQIDWSN